MKFNVILEPAEEGGFNVTVPALDGCFTQGKTIENALENAKEAILCYLEGLEKVNQIKSKPGVLLKELEVCIWVRHFQGNKLLKPFVELAFMLTIKKAVTFLCIIYKKIYQLLSHSMMNSKKGTLNNILKKVEVTIDELKDLI